MRKLLTILVLLGALSGLLAITAPPAFASHVDYGCRTFSWTWANETTEVIILSCLEEVGPNYQGERVRNNMSCVDKQFPDIYKQCNFGLDKKNSRLWDGSTLIAGNMTQSAVINASTAIAYSNLGFGVAPCATYQNSNFTGGTSNLYIRLLDTNNLHGDFNALGGASFTPSTNAPCRGIA